MLFRICSLLPKSVSVATVVSAMCVAGLCTFTSSAQEGHFPQELKWAFNSKVNLVGYTDVEGMRKTEFAKAVQQMKQDVDSENMPFSIKNKGIQQEQLKKLREKLDLTKEDFASFGFVMNLTDIDLPKGGSKDSPEEVLSNILSVIGLTKSIDPRKAATVLKEQAKEAEEDISVEHRKYEKFSVLVSQKGQGPSVWFAFVNDNKDIVAGEKNRGQTVLDRKRHGKKAQKKLPEALTKSLTSITESNQIGVALVPTDKMRNLCRSKARNSDSNKGQGKPTQLSGATWKALSNMKHLTFGSEVAETADVQLNIKLASRADADQIEQFLRNSVLSTIRLMGSRLLPEPLPLLNTLEAAKPNEDEVECSFSLSERDLQIMKKTAEQRPQQ